MIKEEIKGTTKQIYDYIISYVNSHGFPPSVREICQAVKIKSTSTAFYHINKLDKCGYLKKSATKNRALEICDRADLKQTNGIPIVGPILAVENIVDTIELPESFFSGSSLFFLRVQGDSMVKAGIFDGDLIAVNKQESAENGEIVVAMVDDEATVKRLFVGKDCVRLQPENDAYESIIVDGDVSIVGKVVGLIRQNV